ncbi:hypothetical protein [Spongiivirga citrea]|uniref:Glycosyl hydrolase 36 catalytic domain-containing protein n=1 Tax=Spongiivirga citrea TaxID=1481457 RepID=A0A6M0CW06_9FLAO|nr:hypothetical protein [Spongiivirga citrea]NER17950.1 hypothetical protein [Spongiivirga citrea]
MSTKDIYIGNSKVSTDKKEISGELIQFENESYYKISNYDSMRPFFMSIVSDSNHWMFISSNGGLSAGRKSSEYALFPYYTDDKITESADITGGKSVFHIHLNGKTFLWEPFSDEYSGIYKIHRNLYKNSYGNKIIFEEINEDLGLTFRYHWNSSNTYGFVKRSTIVNTSDKEVHITLLDGIQNIMPYGVDPNLQNSGSNLVDAYKKNELQSDINLGIYALSAIIVDKAEPSEALKATSVWSTGIENADYLISSLQVDDFKNKGSVIQETDIRAEKGAYLIKADFVLNPNSEKNWIIVAEVNQSIADIAAISKEIRNEKNLLKIVQDDIEEGSRKLLALNSASDAMQFTADVLRDNRHFSNTLFNIMRGGIFDSNYQIEKSDFIQYIQKANNQVYKQQEDVLNSLPEKFDLTHLKELANSNSNNDFKRLAFEYMPLKFSRRHGDPSRPWNQFTINTTTDDGKKVLDYEGNWRDIFQNWEALAYSYPQFVDNMIQKFVNATTFDGYNPYRVTKDGFDWEVIEPDDPWSYIGYWGDHQIIYLLKLLELEENHFPNTLSNYFNEELFVYANVPYKIKSYDDILKNPKDTIVFDDVLDGSIRKEREIIGADGALLKDAGNDIYKVNLLEKILATLLSKISNFIPEGGIWMNTQRPEWNDANNALVGNGVSMVTLYYLRRFLNFFEGIVENSGEEYFQVSKELMLFFNSIRSTLTDNVGILSSKVSNADRKTVMDGLGNAGSIFRNTIYDGGFSGQKRAVYKGDVLQCIEITKRYLDHSIDANQRKDELFHAYNLMTVDSENEVSISYLSEMLEGQVAVLSSGYISSKTSLEVLDALKASALFREDQYSYILYPNKTLNRFEDKNNIPENRIKESLLVQKLIEDDDHNVIEKDINGDYHFNGSFNNAESLKKALSELSAEKYGDLVKRDTKLLSDIFEEIFDHKSFTGRSGTFYGYEGLGSIYWHMVSKLLVAVQETCWKAIHNNESEEIIGRLLEHYYEINEGIGVHKSPELYGAFPTDPYSHTPGGKGAQQPGMTGQVKEDILCRFAELGAIVENGCLTFNPRLLRTEEFLKTSKTVEYIDINGAPKKIVLHDNTLCFTYCQVPIIYQLSGKEHITVHYNDQSLIDFEGLRLNTEISQQVFERSGLIDSIIVSIKK